MRPSDFSSNIARYWEKVDRREPDECWPWTGEVNNQGYGRFNLWHDGRRTRLLAHRLAVVLAGTLLPERMKVLHRCDNPPCVNPAHLQIGTQGDNMRDALSKGRLDLSGLEIGQRMSCAEARAWGNRGAA